MKRSSKATRLVLGVMTLTASLATQVHVSYGASWEGSDDFSGSLAQWDTTYVHANQPSDGFFLSDGHLQFIRAITTTNYGSSGILFWPHSLPFNASWTATVDAHLNPATTKSSDPVDQDIRAALFLIESVESVTNTLPPKRLRTALSGDATGDQLSLDGPDLPVAGRDFTLGIGFDAATQTGTSFYYPIGQPAQLVILTNLSMNDWTNMQIMLDGLSEYWAVGNGEIWLDNFHVYSTAAPASRGTNAVATLSISLTGFQGTNTANPVKLANKAILSLLNGVLTEPGTGAAVTNYFVDGYGQAVNGARLILAFPAESGSSPTIRVRQVFNRTNIVDTDVTPWLWISQGASVGNAKTGCEILQLCLNNGNGAVFDVRGFAAFSKGDLIGLSREAKGLRLSDQIKAMTASVAGMGHLPLTPGASDSYSVLKGSIVITGTAVEVQ